MAMNGKNPARERLKKGELAKVVVSIGKSPQNVQGVVSFVSPTANPANGQIRIYIEVENQNTRFRPGMVVTATIDKQ